MKQQSSKQSTRTTQRSTTPEQLPPTARERELAERVAELEREREGLLELLVHQQRIAQAGLVTAGLAHDVNNHVQHMSGTAYLALSTSEHDAWREGLERVQQECLELSETTRGFLSFLKRRDTSLGESFGVAEVVEKVHRLANPLAKNGCVVLALHAPFDARVAGEGQLAVQALLNLVTNAIHAVPDGGHVEISTSAPMAGLCRVEVRDDGPGIPESVRANLFRPFSTSRADSGGNGMGLFIVRQIVRKLRGSIRMRTSPEGTVFVVDLPVSK